MQLLKYLSLLYFQFDVDLTLIIISTAIGFFLHCVPPKFPGPSWYRPGLRVVTSPSAPP